MNGLKSIQKRTRVALVMHLVALGCLVASLVVLGSPMSLGSLVRYLMAYLLGYLLVSLGMALGWFLGGFLKTKEKTEPRLMLPPGAGLRDMLHVIYPPKTAERVFDQIIADMQLEWQEAMIHEKKWLGRWVRVRGVVTVFLTAAVYAVATLGSILKLVR